MTDASLRIGMYFGNDAASGSAMSVENLPPVDRVD